MHTQATEYERTSGHYNTPGMQARCSRDATTQTQSSKLAALVAIASSPSFFFLSFFPPALL